MFQKEVFNRFDAELDMRMSKQNDLSAYVVVNEYDDAGFEEVFLDYGELKMLQHYHQNNYQARTKANQNY